MTSVNAPPWGAGGAVQSSQKAVRHFFLVRNSVDNFPGPELSLKCWWYMAKNSLERRTLVSLRSRPTGTRSAGRAARRGACVRLLPDD
jgi:hypothetical protein